MQFKLHSIKIRTNANRAEIPRHQQHHMQHLFDTMFWNWGKWRTHVGICANDVHLLECKFFSRAIPTAIATLYLLSGGAIVAIAVSRCVICTCHVQCRKQLQHCCFCCTMFVLQCVRKFLSVLLLHEFCFLFCLLCFYCGPLRFFSKFHALRWQLPLHSFHMIAQQRWLICNCGSIVCQFQVLKPHRQNNLFASVILFLSTLHIPKRRWIIIINQCGWCRNLGFVFSIFHILSARRCSAPRNVVRLECPACSACAAAWFWQFSCPFCSFPI